MISVSGGVEAGTECQACFAASDRLLCGERGWLDTCCGEPPSVARVRKQHPTPAATKHIEIEAILAGVMSPPSMKL